MLRTHKTSLEFSEPFVSTGVDWITLTSSDETASQRLARFADSITREEHSRGNLQRGWGMSGFTGWQCGQLQCGMRNEEFIMRLSGDCAKTYWGRAYSLSTHVTRLDLQLTFKPTCGPRQFIRNAHKTSLAHSKRFKRGPTVTFITDSNGGDTLYLGKRQSDAMGRLYNKEAEAKLPEWQGCVRAECEFKHNLAGLITADLARATSPFVFIHSAVSTFFRNRGCHLPTNPNPYDYSQPRQRSDIEQRLEWLAKAVKPTVHLAIRCGKHDELLAALGVEVSADGKLRPLGPTGPHSREGSEV